MQLSIIIPTLGRKTELDMLLNSILVANLDFDYEIIIVDQNPESFLTDIIDKYKIILPIFQENVSFKGLSKAKNYGVCLAKGKYISFPDDDCKIFKDTYEKALDLLNEKRCDMVFGKCIDEKDKDSVLKFRKSEYQLDRSNMLGGFVEATVVCKREIFNDYLFDENMGVGEFFGAEEGFDWLYRILTTSNYTAFYSPDIKFYHPQVILSKGYISALNRVFKYRCGTAYLCHKHEFDAKYYKRLYMSKIASIIYNFTDKTKSDYYELEYLSLKVGKLFAKKSLKRT